ncbi:MAG TPA: aminodeoxychorismate synthase component I [Candidatus Limnocylindrales bacterium]|nr:aminodeoxychorismate synthase component I [Candidatus Limnocylindrales bacterium]
MSRPEFALRTAGAHAGAGVRVLPAPELAGERPIDVAERFADLPGLALLESARPGRTGRWSYLSADPIAVLEEPSQGPDPFASARALLRRLPAAPAAGGPPFSGGLVGYLSYDLGRRLERLPSKAAADQDLPLLRLALHDWVVAWDRRTGAAWLCGRALDGDVDRLEARLDAVRARLAGSRPAPPPGPEVDALVFRSGLDRAAFVDRVEAIRDAIAAGELYQANLARRLEAAFAGSPWSLYRRLRTGDPALFAAFLDLGPAPGPGGGAPRAILSASPEPFLSVTSDGDVATDPIKGTRPRGRTRDADRALARELLASAKDRAENVMIVDVLRNDLGRVARPGSVRVPRLCRLERTAAVQHLVSTVTARLASDRDPFDLLRAAFPGGSITGAPKIRAMELIESLEPVRRGPYTGAIGWIGPDRAMATSIAIRTLVADGRRLTLHVGGGITWRSDPAAEWDETVAKAHGPLSAIGGAERT